MDEAHESNAAFEQDEEADAAGDNAVPLPVAKVFTQKVFWWSFVRSGRTFPSLGAIGTLSSFWSYSFYDLLSGQSLNV